MIFNLFHQEQMNLQDDASGYINKQQKMNHQNVIYLSMLCHWDLTLRRC